MRITRQLIKQNPPVTVTYGDIQVSVEKTSNGIHYEEMLGRSVVTYSYCATHPVRSSLGKYYFYAVDCQLYGIRMQNHTCASLPPLSIEYVCKCFKKYKSAFAQSVGSTYVCAASSSSSVSHSWSGVRMNCRFYNVRTRSA